MKHYKIFLFFFVFICLAMPLNAHANKTYNVSYKTFFVPIAVNEQYIEVHTWYPTRARALLRTIEREGKQFSLARNADPIEEDLNLILISTPSFANSYDYASLAHSLARKGFLVALITHIGDNKENMVYTLSGWQLLWRAIQIKHVVEFIDNNFSIVDNTISSISFGETALAPLLLDNFIITSNDYPLFCLQSENDAFCTPPYNAQIEKMIRSIKIYQEESTASLETYEAQSQRIRQENRSLQANWDRAIQRAMARSEEAPEEPKWLELPDKPIEADIYAPYIKNFFFIEPLFSFLIQSNGQISNNIEIFTFASTRPAIPNTSMHVWQLRKIFANKITELSLEKYNQLDLVDRKTNNSNNLLSPELLLNISEREQVMFIESFVKNITENILNY